MFVTGLVLFFCMLVSCIRNYVRVNMAKVGHHDLSSSSQYEVRPDSVLIQQLEEDMLSHFHTDVLVALQVSFIKLDSFWVMVHILDN